MQPPRFDVASSMLSLSMAGPGTDRSLGAEITTRLFVEGLIQRSEVDLGPATPFGEAGLKDSARVTHSLVDEDGRRVLKRNHFDCGFCQRSGPFACA